MYAVDQWEGVACAVAVAATVVVEMKSLGSFCQNVCVHVRACSAVGPASSITRKQLSKIRLLVWEANNTKRAHIGGSDPTEPAIDPHTQTHHHHHDNHHDHEEDDDTDAHQDEGYGSCSRQHSGLWLRSYGINKRTATKILAVSLYRHANKYEHTDTYRNTDTLTDFEN